MLRKGKSIPQTVTVNRNTVFPNVKGFCSICTSLVTKRSVPFPQGSFPPLYATRVLIPVNLLGYAAIDEWGRRCREVRSIDVAPHALRDSASTETGR